MTRLRQQCDYVEMWSSLGRWYIECSDLGEVRYESPDAHLEPMVPGGMHDWCDGVHLLDLLREEA